MNAYFEDAGSLEFTNLPQTPFYCFYNSTMKNDLPIMAHWHYYIELLYIELGVGKIIINGMTVVVEKGDYIVILPKDVHSIYPLEDIDFKYAVIKFDPSLLFNSTKDTFIFKNIIPLLSPVPPDKKIFKSDTLDENKVIIFNEILNLSEQKSYGHEFLIKSHLLYLFYEFTNKVYHDGIDLIGGSISNDDFSTILPAFKFVQENYMKQITTKDAANYCNLSYSYFSRLFKQVSDISFTVYLNFIRVTEAERLLLLKSLSVTEIGFEVGFSDTSYFIKQFKTFKKITPKQFLHLK